MAWKMNCLLCEPGSRWNPPRPHYGSTDLVEIQEHLMDDHAVTQEELRQQRSVCLAPNHYVYILPDSRHWLDARKED